MTCPAQVKSPLPSVFRGQLFFRGQILHPSQQLLALRNDHLKLPKLAIHGTLENQTFDDLFPIKNGDIVSRSPSDYHVTGHFWLRILVNMGHLSHQILFASKIHSALAATSDQKVRKVKDCDKGLQTGNSKISKASQLSTQLMSPVCFHLRYQVTIFSM